jgi:F-type H+-transporting ATPase subunit b
MLEIPPNFGIVAAQIAIFVVLWLVLKRLWFAPALRLMHERAARSEGAVEEARKIQAEAAALRAEHAAALEQVRAEAQREMQEIVRAAEVEQKRLIEAAREESQQDLSEARSRIAEEVAGARQRLRDAAGELAVLVAQKVVGRPL